MTDNIVDSWACVAESAVETRERMMVADCIERATIPAPALDLAIVVAKLRAFAADTIEAGPRTVASQWYALPSYESDDSNGPATLRSAVSS